MKNKRAVLCLLGLLLAGALVQAADGTLGRVRLLTTADFGGGSTLFVAATGLNAVNGSGTDIINPDVTSFCDIHFNSVRVTLPTATAPGTAVLIGKVVDASDPVNLGAFVKITASTNGTANFVFQTLSGAGSTGAAGVNMTGTVEIVNIF